MSSGATVGKPGLGKGPMMYHFKEGSGSGSGEGVVKPVFAQTASGVKSGGIVKPQFYAKGRHPGKPADASDKKKDSEGGDGDEGEEGSESDGEIDMMLADLEKDVGSSDEEEEEEEEGGSERKKQRVT